LSEKIEIMISLCFTFADLLFTTRSEWENQIISKNAELFHSKTRNLILQNQITPTVIFYRRLDFTFNIMLQKIDRFERFVKNTFYELNILLFIGLKSFKMFSLFFHDLTLIFIKNKYGKEECEFLFLRKMKKNVKNILFLLQH